MPIKKQPPLTKTSPQVIKIGDLAAYQEGSVVSRTLINQPTGTVTFFAFAADQGLSEHTAPFDALVQIVDGEAEIFISGVKYEVKKGQMLILPAGQPHSLRAPKPFKMLLTMIRTSR